MYLYYVEHNIAVEKNGHFPYITSDKKVPGKSLKL